MAVKYDDDEKPEIQMTSMMDCIFLMLIFFLVSSQLKKIEREVPLTLPESDVAVSVGTEPDLLKVSVTEKGELSSMSPLLKYDKYPVTIIRPLCYVAEDSIKAHAVEKGFAGFTCTCSYQDNSARKLARQKLEFLTDGELAKKYHLLQ